MLIIKNARLLGPLTEGYDLPLGDLWIDGGKILEIREPGWTPSESAAVAAERIDGATIIDAAGKTVLPG
ncbi:MAG: hypothetical protein IKK22_06345, partial [Firmicutes bacterium]|nr:hypothetical protein [Bacillota bacterium]